MIEKRSILNQLEDTIQSIQTHRETAADAFNATRRQANAAWAAVLEAAKELRESITGHQRLRYFTIARDELSITVSFHAQAEGGGRGEVLVMARHHPDGKYPGTEAVWVREPGKDDKRIIVAEEAVRHIVNFCARNLARSS